MQRRSGWAVFALPLLFSFLTTPLPSYADNPKAILGKMVHLHYKRSVREVQPGIFVPTQSFDTRIIRQQLRIQENGDIVPVDLSTAEDAFRSQTQYSYKIGQDVNLLANPERVHPGIFKRFDFSYWIVSAAFQRNILSTSLRVRFTERSNGMDQVMDEKMVIAFSPDGKKCEIRSVTQKISYERFASKGFLESAMQYQMSCRVRSPLDAEEID